MKVLGIMSGSSMDGVDLALCEVNESAQGWQVEILEGVTVPYSETWRVRLSQLRYQNAELYAKTDVFYGRYLGELAAAFFFNKRGILPIWWRRMDIPFSTIPRVG